VTSKAFNIQKKNIVLVIDKARDTEIFVLKDNSIVLLIYTAIKYTRLLAKYSIVSRMIPIFYFAPSYGRVIPVPRLTRRVRTLPKVFLVTLKSKLIKMKENKRVP
jgi:hypothetical protein